MAVAQGVEVVTGERPEEKAADRGRESCEGEAPIASKDAAPTARSGRPETHVYGPRGTIDQAPPARLALAVGKGVRSSADCDQRCR